MNQRGHCSCDFTEWISRCLSRSSAERLPAAKDDGAQSGKNRSLPRLSTPDPRGQRGAETQLQRLDLLADGRRRHP
jgi:hypothetical protein